MSLATNFQSSESSRTLHTDANFVQIEKERWLFYFHDIKGVGWVPITGKRSTKVVF